MRVKSMLILIIVNIAVMFLVSILYEYVDLTERFVALEDTISESLEASIGLSTNSEEFFGESYADSRLTSMATDKDSVNLNATLSYWSSDGGWQYVNLYNLCKWSYERGYKVPKTASDAAEANLGMSSISTDNQTANVFAWLYGGIENEYNNTSLNWANTNNTRKEEYSEAKNDFEIKINTAYRDRNTINSNFSNFYNNIGKYQKTVGYLKVKNGTGYDLKPVTYPVLANMGLDFNTPVDSKNFNSLSSTYMHDNFSSSYKIGKTSGDRYSIYFLTPNSLGVTYIPMEVLKPSFKITLVNMIRLNKLSGGSGDINATDLLKSAEGCIETNVYANSGNNHITHKVKSGEEIYNDGYVEYDLNSVQMKVDYFLVDFSKDTNAQATILTRLQGCETLAFTKGYIGNTVHHKSAEQSQLETRKKSLSSYLNRDSALNSTDTEYVEQYKKVSEKRIVARVSVKLKVHVPYTSPVMQWLCQNFGNVGSSGTGHFSIKQWDVSTSHGNGNSDDLWFTYTTYYMTSRKG